MAATSCLRLVSILSAVAASSGCGAGKARAPADAAGQPVWIELAWVVAAAPTEVKEVGCKLVLRVAHADSAKKADLHELGTWWRAQTAAVELVQVKNASGPIFFRTAATFGEDGDLTKGPEFEVVRERDGAVIVRGKDEDTPWRQLERVEVPARTPVEARQPRPE